MSFKNLLEVLLPSITILFSPLSIGGDSPISQGENLMANDPYKNLVIDNLWEAYKSDNIQNDGRTIDFSAGMITTSEGQSYSLLRAVWMNDKEEFDRVLKWTNNNLARPNDELFSWKWGRTENGDWSVLVEDDGDNTATDADQDIALALIFAHRRWADEAYLKQAKAILSDIWQYEVYTYNGKHYLLPGNWAKTDAIRGRPILINPSYFSFAAYDIFQQVDPENPWMELKATSYEVLQQSSSEINEGENIFLPPDWIILNRFTGELSYSEEKDPNYSDDAIRVPFRVGLDYKWNNDPRAYAYLSKMDFLVEEWEKNKKLYASYNKKGEALVDYESPSMYGSAVPLFVYADSLAVHDLVYEKLYSLYDPDERTFTRESKVSYYSKNWVWFGLAFYQDRLPNLYEEIE